MVSGVALWSAVQIINQHAEDSYREAQSLLGAQAQYWIRSRRDEGIEQARLHRSAPRRLSPDLPRWSNCRSAPRRASRSSIIATDLAGLAGRSAMKIRRTTISARPGSNSCSRRTAPGCPQILAERARVSRRRAARTARRPPPAAGADSGARAAGAPRAGRYRRRARACRR